MKTQSSNKIEYAGELTVSLKSGDNIIPHKFKNAGCKPMWDALAKAMAGYDISKDRPRYIDVVSADDNKWSLMVAPVPFVGVVWGMDVNSSPTSTSVVYTATVTAGEKLFDSTTACTLLMLNHRGEVMATIEHVELTNIWNALGPGVDLIFEWELIFSNKEAIKK